MNEPNLENIVHELSPGLAAYLGRMVGDPAAAQALDDTCEFYTEDDVLRCDRRQSD